MTTASFKEHINTGNITMRTTGHAQSAPAGEDLICAAATGYALQAAQSVRGMERLGWLLKPPVIDVKEGKCYISFRPKAEYRLLCFNMMQVIATGYQILAENFPEYVKFNPFGSAVSTA